MDAYVLIHMQEEVAQVGTVVSLSRRYPKRITLELTDDQHAWLKSAKREDGIAANARLRAAISFLSDHPEMQQEVRELALQMQAEEEADEVA
jgi:hypothetical protein